MVKKNCHKTSSSVASRCNHERLNLCYAKEFCHGVPRKVPGLQRGLNKKTKSTAIPRYLLLLPQQYALHRHQRKRCMVLMAFLKENSLYSFICPLISVLPFLSFDIHYHPLGRRSIGKAAFTRYHTISFIPATAKGGYVPLQEQPRKRKNSIQ